jgi:hypothetical protein
MAAHLRPLGRMRCDETPCDRAATAQLHNTYNAVLGKFCRKHAKRRLEKQLEAERRASAPSVPDP